MNAQQIIARKRDGAILSAHEIGDLVRGYVAGEVHDYHMAAWAMAVYLRGMNIAETVALTESMLHSGQTLEAGDVSRRVDKHSTGGIGDKSSLIVAPLLACCGLQVPMISGRGLGSTGGTLDKLESIPGFRTDLSPTEIRDVVRSVGCVMTGATDQLVPADRKLYRLRDVTATVGSIPLITASILSKKLAERLSALVLDVKFGGGTFMKTRDHARALAQSLVDVGTRLGLETTALLTAMDQPNGRMVGNALEIDEALQTLAGRGPADLRELVLSLAGELLQIKSLARDDTEARSILADHLDSGRALQKFRAMVAAQGGDLDPPRPLAATWTLMARQGGFVSAVDAERLGLAVVEMGGGRGSIDDRVDHAVGLEILVRVGDRVARDQPLLNVFATPQVRARAMPLLEPCISIGPSPACAESLIAERITARPFAEVSAPLKCSTLRTPAPLVEKVAAAKRRELIDAALDARQRAHAPYSGFRVGAAVLGTSGRIYTGANVENASFGLTLCAERVAMAAAVSGGEARFTMLAVATDGGAAPCGACRQFVAEFCEDLPIVMIDARGENAEPVETSLAQLLPRRFEFRAASDQNAGYAGGHETGQGAAEHGP